MSSDNPTILLNSDWASSINEALAFVAQRDFNRLTRNELVHLAVISKGVVASQTPYEKAKELARIIINLIDKCRPEGDENLTKKDWQVYLLLKSWVVESMSWHEICERLNIRRTKYYEYKKNGRELIGDMLYRKEQSFIQRAGKESLTKHNLPRKPDPFIRRRDPEGRIYVSHITKLLRKSRPYIVSIRGHGGVGKTTLAVFTCWRCVELEFFEQIVFTTAKVAEFELNGRLVPVVGRVSSLEEIVDTIAKELGLRRVLAGYDLVAKINLVYSELEGRRILVVVDNTEQLSEVVSDEIMGFLRRIPEPITILLTSREEKHDTSDESIHLKGMQITEAKEYIDSIIDTKTQKRIGEKGIDELIRDTKRNPLAIKMILGYLSLTGADVNEAIDATLDEEGLLDFIFGNSYQRLNPLGKIIIHMLSPYHDPVPEDFITNIFGKEQGCRKALKEIKQLMLLDTTDKRVQLIDNLRRFVAWKSKDGSFSWPENFVSKLLPKAAGYYIRELGRLLSTDEAVSWLLCNYENLIRTMSLLKTFNLNDLTIKLFEKASLPLFNAGYAKDRLLWGRWAARKSWNSGKYGDCAWFCVHDIGWVLLNSKASLRKGKAITRRAIRAARKLEEMVTVGLGIRNLAWATYRIEGRWEEARTLASESLSILEKTENKRWLASAKSTLAKCLYKKGDLYEAEQLYIEVIEEREGRNHTVEAALAKADLALVLEAKGEPEDSIKLITQALEVGYPLPWPNPVQAYLLKVEAEIVKAQGNLSKAKRSLEDSLNHYDALGIDWAIEYVQKRLSELQDHK